MRQETIEAETKTVTTVSRKTKKYRPRKESSICFRGWFVSRCFCWRWSHPLEIRWSETKPRISGDKELVIRFIAAASKLIQTQFFSVSWLFRFFSSFQKEFSSDEIFSGPKNFFKTLRDGRVMHHHQEVLGSIPATTNLFCCKNWIKRRMVNFSLLYQWASIMLVWGQNSLEDIFSSRMVSRKEGESIGCHRMMVKLDILMYKANSFLIQIKKPIWPYC